MAPHDVLSTDQVTWMKAPMLPELGMDWLVEVTSERYYGPTTLGAIQEFVRLGEINEQTFVINSCDGARRQISEMSLALHSEAAADTASPQIAEVTLPSRRLPACRSMCRIESAISNKACAKRKNATMLWN
jgi:hypothetical protein